MFRRLLLLVALLLCGALHAQVRVAPRNYDEAQELGRAAMDAMQTENAAAKDIEAKLPTAPEAERAELQKSLEATRIRAAAERETATFYLAAALKLIDDEAPLDEINVNRYLLSYLYFSDGKYREAAKLGEFVSRRYPDSDGARQSAKIALAAYLKIFQEQRAEKKSAESKHIVDLADFIQVQWPNEPEAIEALATLVQFMTVSREFDAALVYLQKIPEESPRRRRVELYTGHALWFNYLARARDWYAWKDGTKPKPANANLAQLEGELARLRFEARRTLVAAWDRPRDGEVTRAEVRAVVCLAQAHADFEENLEAIAVLEHKTLGPLTLVRAGHVFADQLVAEEACKVGLRVYQGVLDAGQTNDPAETRKIIAELRARLKVAQVKELQP